MASLALAARPPGACEVGGRAARAPGEGECRDLRSLGRRLDSARWRSLLDHLRRGGVGGRAARAPGRGRVSRPPVPVGRRSRRSLAGARCSTTWRVVEVGGRAARAPGRGRVSRPPVPCVGRRSRRSLAGARCSTTWRGPAARGWTTSWGGAGAPGASVRRVQPIAVSGEPAEVVATVRGWLDAADPPPLVVETSGSTGRPKRVLLPRAAVLASVAATSRRLGGSGRWSLRLPASYVAGLQVITRSLVAGHDPVLDGWGDATYTSLVPTQLHRMLDDPEDTERLVAMEAVLLGGGPIDRGLRERAETAGVRVVATYGMAETCGGCVYDGYALDGVAVALGGDGRIRLGGPVLFRGYDGDPTATAEVLRDGWFLTSDAGRPRRGRSPPGARPARRRGRDRRRQRADPRGRRPAPRAPGRRGRGRGRRPGRGVGHPGGGVRGR